MIKLYTPNVDRYGGYEWGRNVGFKRGTYSDFITKGITITPALSCSRTSRVDLSWEIEIVLHISCARLLCNSGRKFQTRGTNQ